MQETYLRMKSIENIVKDNELLKHEEKTRQFDYNVNDKAAKAKFVKGAKRIPFEIVDNSSSSNLIFSLGAN